MAGIDELGRKRSTEYVSWNDEGYPRVSVVVPMRNESEHIGRCIDALQRQRYPASRLEIVLVDGVSQDETLAVVQSRLPGARIPIRVLDNPGVTAARGLNIGVLASTGQVIVILGAHSEPDDEFIIASIDALWRSEADCVGGRIESVAHGAVGQAIALAMSSSFGVGDARFRTSNERGFVDTVAFGAYRREVFDRIGLFDESLERNVDDEFNYRLRGAGGSIYLDPDIRCRYYTRQTYRDLFEQYRHYGEWKVVVARRHPLQMRPRHFVPAAFIGTVGASAALATLGAKAPLSILAGAYAAAAGAAATVAATRAGKPSLAPAMVPAFACLHVGYGIGMWQGLWRFSLRPALGRSRAPWSRPAEREHVDG